MKYRIAALGILCGIAASAQAEIVKVQINGSIEFNLIRNGQLNRTDVPAGSPASISFLLDSNLFLNDPDGLPTRGYTVNQSSFVASFGAVNIGLESPFPGGTPMFVLRNNDPAVDGFFLSTGTAYPFPLPTTEPGFFGQFGCNFSVGYEGDVLSSLNIVNAVGSYDYTGLTNFYWSTDDGGNDAMGMIFDNMTISVVPAPATLSLLGAAALLRRRR